MKSFGQSAGKIEREKWEFVETLEYKDTGRKPDKKTGAPRLMRINIPVGGKDYVSCRECNKKFTFLERHLLEKHQMTKKDYCKKHGPQWKTVCDKTRDGIKKVDDRLRQTLSMSSETLR